MNTIEMLKSIEETVQTGRMPRSREWGGADIVITRRPPLKSDNGFYPDPEYVVTEHSGELSWLFEKLRDAFYAEKLIDGFSKIEFFSRLASRAGSCIEGDKNITARILCNAVLNEAYAVYNEIINGEFV